jgi:spore coat protein U-like protein
MKTALKIAAGVGALSALSGLATVAHAQNSATATAAGSATIIQAISVSKSTDLAFGTIVKPSSGTSTISVDTAGVRSITGTAVAANATGVSRALFAVTGEGASVFSISVPSSFSMSSGANSLVVTTVSSATSATLSGTAGAQGSATFGVGGSFPLATNTASGAYAGNFVVTVTYN